MLRCAIAKFRPAPHPGGRSTRMGSCGKKSEFSDSGVGLRMIYYKNIIRFAERGGVE
jgi:hypothetical protein